MHCDNMGKVEYDRRKLMDLEYYIKGDFHDQSSDIKLKITKNGKEVMMTLKDYGDPTDYENYERSIFLDGDEKLKKELNKKYDLGPINQEDLINLIDDMIMHDGYDIEIKI